MSLKDLKLISKAKNIYILGNGLDFVLACKNNKKVANIKITSDLADAIMKAATGFKVNLIAAYNALAVNVNQKEIVFNESDDVEEAATVLVDVAKAVKAKDIVLQFIGTDAEIVLDKAETKLFMNYLKDNDAEVDPTAGMYDVIDLVNEVPATAQMLAKHLYVLRNAVGEYNSLTAFILSDGVRNIMDTKTGKLTPAPEPEPEPPGPGPEPPVPEPDPEDASTIPDSEVKEEVTGNIGGADVDEVQVWDNAITDRLNVSAADEVSIVNSTLSDGAVVINIK